MGSERPGPGVASTHLWPSATELRGQRSEVRLEGPGRVDLPAGGQLVFSRSGKPVDSAFAESFNGHFRAKCLDQHWFASLEEARQTVEAWRGEYNAERPHGALGQQTPAEFEARWHRDRDLLAVAD